MLKGPQKKSILCDMLCIKLHLVPVPSTIICVCVFFFYSEFQAQTKEQSFDRLTTKAKFCQFL